jgi:hypothetical protein
VFPTVALKELIDSFRAVEALAKAVNKMPAHENATDERLIKKVHPCVDAAFTELEGKNGKNILLLITYPDPGNRQWEN